MPAQAFKRKSSRKKRMVSSVQQLIPYIRILRRIQYGLKEDVFFFFRFFLAKTRSRVWPHKSIGKPYARRNAHSPRYIIEITIINHIRDFYGGISFSFSRLRSYRDSTPVFSFIKASVIVTTSMMAIRRQWPSCMYISICFRKLRNSYRAYFGILCRQW